LIFPALPGTSPARRTPSWTPSAISPRRPNPAIGSESRFVRPAIMALRKNLIFSYPIRTDGKKWEIVQNIPLKDFSKSKIAATENELKEEKSLVMDLLPK
jgi:malate dehydrogenase